MFRKLLLPIDLNDDDSWKRPLAYAIEHCRAFDARVLLVTVLPEFGTGMVAAYFPKDFAKRAQEEAEQRLCAFAEAHVPAELLTGTMLRHGTIYEEILAAARQEGSELIVMGAHRPELSDYLLGPNAARVVRHFDGSVIVVRG